MSEKIKPERVVQTHTMFNGTVIVALTNSGRLFRKEISYLDAWQDWEEFESPIEEALSE